MDFYVRKKFELTFLDRPVKGACLGLSAAGVNVTRGYPLIQQSGVISIWPSMGTYYLHMEV